MSEDPWMQHMRRGDFESAWQISDALLSVRRDVPCYDWPRHLQYIWNGSPLKGKRVLIRCYHGLGDTIQFIRYARCVKQIALEVIVWVQPVLLPLLRSVEGIDRLMPLHDGVPDAVYDVDVELMELPYIFRTKLSSIPADVPYLKVSPAQEFTSRDTLKVGVVWRAGEWDERRSMSAELMASLASIEDVTLLVLQDRKASKKWPNDCGVILSPEPVDALARAIASVDLLITIDSLPAHLGGALGVPTWTLLPAEADWRWMIGREDSPWYPTMRLWRQTSPGDWAGVMTRVRDELQLLVTRAKKSADRKSALSARNS